MGTWFKFVVYLEYGDIRSIEPSMSDLGVEHGYTPQMAISTHFKSETHNFPTKPGVPGVAARAHDHAEWWWMGV